MNFANEQSFGNIHGEKIIFAVRKVISNASLCAPPPPATNTTRPKVIGNEGVVIGNQAPIINGGDKAVPPGLNKCDVEMKRRFQKFKCQKLTF